MAKPNSANLAFFFLLPTVLFAILSFSSGSWEERADNHMTVTLADQPSFCDRWSAYRSNFIRIFLSRWRLGKALETKGEKVFLGCVVIVMTWSFQQFLWETHEEKVRLTRSLAWETANWLQNLRELSVNPKPYFPLVCLGHFMRAQNAPHCCRKTARWDKVNAGWRIAEIENSAL